MNARSMSGINDSTSSGGGGTGDALLAGGTEASPQTFTGFNRFEELVNFRAVRPSLITTASTSNPTDDEFITKLDGEDLFGSLSGSAQLNGGGNTAEDPPQIFTGFNEFDENVVLGGQYLTFKNGTRRVIDMSENPDQPTNTNKILMTAPKNEIILIGTGSVNQLSMTAQNSAINSFLQTGTVNTVNLISQVGANSTITTDGKFTTATAPTSGTHLCNKTYVDAVTTGAFAENSQANPNVAYVVGGGNPTASSGGDNLNGRMDMPATTTGSLEVEITPPGTNVKIDFSIFGEWNADSWDKGVILARAAQAADGSFTYTSLLRADTDASAPAAARVIVTFGSFYMNDEQTTPEHAIGFFIDRFVVAGTTYRYIPVLVNAAVTGSNHTFKLNRPITASNNSFAERGISAITATILNV